MTDSYIVLLHDDEPEGNKNLKRLIAEQFPGDSSIEFTELVFLVRGDALSIKDVTDRLRANDSESPGLVVQLTGSASGLSWSRIWDWLKAAEVVRT